MAQPCHSRSSAAMLNADTDVAPGGVRLGNGGTGSIPLHRGWHRLALRAMLTGAGTVGIPAPPAPCLPLWRILHLLPPFLQQQPEQAAKKKNKTGARWFLGAPFLPAASIGEQGALRGLSSAPSRGLPLPAALLQMLSRDAQPGASASQSLRGLRADRGRRGTPAAPAPARHAWQLQRRVTLPVQRLPQPLPPPRRQR